MDTGPIGGYLFVFPRTSVAITQRGAAQVVADVNTIMFYNRDQEYRRDPISPRGDICDWFRVDGATLREAIAEFDPWVQDRGNRPFELTHGPSTPRLYWMQRQLSEALRCSAESAKPDDLRVSEGVHRLLRDALHVAYEAREPLVVPFIDTSTRSRHYELTEVAKAILARTFKKNLSLKAIARLAQCSPFHLSRVFHTQVGMTLHAYRNRLRMHASLEQLAEGQREVGEVGLRLGYATPSHFSRTFRQTFGTTPTQMRRLLNLQHVRKLQNSLAAPCPTQSAL